MSDGLSSGGVTPAGGAPDFSGARLLVVGDVMIDRYFHGATRRISPEAPVQAVHVEQFEERPGGAANVAVNVRALGASVALIGLTGDDADAGVLERLLGERGVGAHFAAVRGGTTIVKLRVVSRGQQLIRLDFEDGFKGAALSQIETLLSAQLSGADAVVFSDYAKGCLRNVQRLIRLARDAGKPVFVDPKGHDFSRYADATVLTPNFPEFEAVVGPCRSDDEIAEKGLALKTRLGLGALLVTRGEHGMSLVESAEVVHHLPTQAHEVYDVTGAGDTAISVLATASALGLPLVEATRLANRAASLVVEKSGTATVSRDELNGVFGRAASGAVCTRDELAARVADARRAGQRIVMTNGCFDLLHAGHVACLSEAARLGDKLLVAVNDDASVTALKGAGRPINPLHLRMRLLAALEAVDWVVAFSEPTPERLIECVSPDVLVKGGDYEPRDIAGYAHVSRSGGEVVVLDYLEGVSTSGLIADIRKQ